MSFLTASAGIENSRTAEGQTAKLALPWPIFNRHHPSPATTSKIEIPIVLRAPRGGSRSQIVTLDDASHSTLGHAARTADSCLVLMRGAASRRSRSRPIERITKRGRNALPSVTGHAMHPSGQPPYEQHGQWEDTSFRPRMPAMISPTKKNRARVAGSLKINSPSTNVPTAPMPVQTA